MEIKTVNEQNTLMIRLITPVSELPEVIGRVYGEIGEYAQQRKIAFAGPPFVIYYNMDMQALDAEMGFPVEKPATGEGRIQPGRLPGGKVVSAIHTGPYSTLEKTYNELMASVAEKGIKIKPWMYEIYLNSPMDTPEARLKTEICFPIADESSS